jgi:hypothetical protein
VGHDSVVVNTFGSRPRFSGSIPGLTGHYHHVLMTKQCLLDYYVNGHKIVLHVGYVCLYVAAVGKLLTLNCLAGGTKQCMKGATIGSCLLCLTMCALL